ncbi:MAG: hypothetical protein ACOCUS_07480 [Polyangiales bacterium]
MSRDWIRAEIRDYVVRGYPIVRLGTTRTERGDMIRGVREALDGALGRLSERRIVDARMLSESSWTLEQLGREMGVSKERVRTSGPHRERVAMQPRVTPRDVPA